jgi:tripartite-type tricarboxylate transporter receptor subunit TctC
MGMPSERVLSDAARAVVRWPPGGAADLLARLPLSERLGQPFIIEYRPGAGSNIATEAVVRAPPNGHTLLYSCGAWNFGRCSALAGHA